MSVLYWVKYEWLKPGVWLREAGGGTVMGVAVGLSPLLVAWLVFRASCAGGAGGGVLGCDEYTKVGMSGGLWWIIFCLFSFNLILIKMCFG